MTGPTQLSRPSIRATTTDITVMAAPTKRWLGAVEPASLVKPESLVPQQPVTTVRAMSPPAESCLTGAPKTREAEAGHGCSPARVAPRSGTRLA